MKINTPSTQVTPQSLTSPQAPTTTQKTEDHFKQAFVDGFTGAFLIATSVGRLFGSEARNADRFSRSRADEMIGSGALYGAKLMFGSVGSFAKGLGGRIAALFGSSIGWLFKR